MKAKTKKALADRARTLKLVASTTRLSIIHHIFVAGPSDVSQIAHGLGMTHSGVSHQLAVLSGAKIVASKRDGRRQVYNFGEGEQAMVVARIVDSVNIARA